ncbi:MAG: hypothetical protein ACJ75B_09600 [Flavisolibacter sp.]
MKILSLIFLLLFGLAVYGQANNPFLTLKFDKVIMYDFEPSDGKGGSIVEDNGQLTKNIKKQILLDKQTWTNLDEKLGSKSSFGGAPAACYDPHLGFVYYYKSKIVGYINICMACNRLHSSIDIPAQKQGKVKLSDGSVEYLGIGMSKSFRQFLTSFLKRNNFSHQI